MANCDHPPPNTGFAPRRLYQNQNGTASQPIVGGKGLPGDSNEQLNLTHQSSAHLHDSNNLAMKTPVSILQELLSRRGITPSYELIQMEGAIHEPTFRYRVSFNDKEVPFTAMGAGRSKKEAKHSAARALIDKLTGVQLPESQANDVDANSNCGGGIGESKGAYAEKVMGNPIGWLQEMCMSLTHGKTDVICKAKIILKSSQIFTEDNKKYICISKRNLTKKKSKILFSFLLSPSNVHNVICWKNRPMIDLSV